MELLPESIEADDPGPLGILGLHHISRTTTRLPESLEFYKTLGFRELRRPPFSFRGAWLYGFGIQIHLIEVAAAGLSNEGTTVSAVEVPAIDSRRNHIAFRVQEVEALIGNLQRWGIEYLERVNAGGVRQIFIRDPDGHQFEFAVVPDPKIGYRGE